jgi:anti-anti-sigma factor
MDASFNIQAAQVDGTALVVAKGEIDLATAPILRETIEQLHGRVIVDLTEVTFLDSSCIGVLVGQKKRLARTDGDVVLRGVGNGLVRRTLEIVGLRDWIED